MGNSGSRSANGSGVSSELNSVRDLGVDYLQLSCEAVERVLMLTSPEQSRSLHLNQAQCKLLAEALSEAVQSAKQDIHGLDPSSVQLFAPAFRELCRVAGDCENLVRDCCEENWLAAAILLADSRQVFELRVSELKWCARAWRIVREHGLKGGVWFEDFYKSSKASVADRGRDMGGDTARLRIAFEEDLRTMRANLAEMQGNVNFEEEVRELAAYVLSRCEMVDGVRPDYEGARNMYELPRFSESVFQHEELLGGGSYGNVTKVTWHQIPVAVKKFYGGYNSESVEKEVSSMTKLGSHPRSVGFLGTVRLRDVHEKAIVMELLHCDLNRYLYNRRQRESRNSSSDGRLPLHVAVDLLLQVAEGIEGFHKVRLFHRDVKSLNILVQPVEKPVLREEGYVRVKLADFGVTQARSSIFSIGVGTTIWMAPELIRGYDGSEVPPLIVPAKADAYSFAMVCYEILSGKIPYQTEKSEMGMHMFKNYVKGGGRPSLPAALPSRLTSLVKRCWDMEPTKRPSFTAICRELRFLKFLLTIGGEMQFQALDGPDEVAERLTAKIVERLLWIDHRELHRIRHIGSGGYGSVDECELRGQRVAVKNLLRCPTRKRVEEEAALLVRVEHSNVVKLIGCSFNEEEQKGTIVMELMDQDLHHLIRHNMRVRSTNAPPFPLPVALEIMLKVATAMKHIRSCNVLHRDLKTTNILVNAIRTGSSSQEPVTEEGSRYVVKLADFGLSKYKMGDSMFTTKASEAQFWRAPETSEARNYSWPADVFSYGVVCYEILSGKKPFEEKQGPELLKLVRVGKRSRIPAYCPTTVTELVNACWATNPDVRPEFAEICTTLEACISYVNLSSVEPGMAGH